jgi:hypothetical protein
MKRRRNHFGAALDYSQGAYTLQMSDSLHDEPRAFETCIALDNCDASHQYQAVGCKRVP